MPNLDNQTIQLIIIAVTAAAVLLQTIILLAIFMSVRKAARSVTEKVEDLRSSVMPLISDTREVFARISPKVEAAATDLAGIVQGLRKQTEEMESTATDMLERLRHQTGRLDAMFSGVLDAADRAGGFVADGVGGVLRQISALVAGGKAIVESLRTFDQGRQPARSRGDEDTFV